MGRRCSGYGSAWRQRFRDRARGRVEDLQGVLAGLQAARRERRAGDVALLEEKAHQMLREWKAELTDPSPASTLAGKSRVSSDLSLDIGRLLQLGEEEDDATSKLDELPSLNLKPELVDVLGPCGRSVQGGAAAVVHEDDYMYQELQEHGYLGDDHYKGAISVRFHNTVVNCSGEASLLGYQQFNLHQEITPNVFFDTNGDDEGNMEPYISDSLLAICSPPSAFLRPKCALWDCPRPVQGSEWCYDYCSIFHATLALNEGPPGMTPVLRPGGIDLKDAPLFAALCAKRQGKNVGIPECEGAATAKSPWNAPELFDLCFLEGESLREWLFFDKPRRAFESGNRKQRSLPDYRGRGWHESRKQVMKEFGGLKRSYYMDPQPLSHYEWHLYEYEIDNCDALALYRLEFKLVDPKKIAKSRVTSNSLLDLHHQMGWIDSENHVDCKRPVKARSKANQKDTNGNVDATAEMINKKENALNAYHTSDQMVLLNENSGQRPSIPCAYSIESLNDYYET